MATTKNAYRFNGSTARELIREGTDALKRASENFSYRVGLKGDAEYLLTWACGEDLEPGAEVTAAERRRFERAVARRCDGEPIPYIVGKTEFDGLELRVRKGAFVPRWTTEAMAQEAAKKLQRRDKPVHVDLATGIGPVALAVAHRVPHAKVYGLDLSAKAVALATENAQQLGLRNARFLHGDLYAPLPRTLRSKVDAITIHPPYVADHEVAELPRELKDFEPKMSLTDRSGNGLGLLERTAREAERWLKPNGWLIVEVGAYLARDAQAVIRENGFAKVDSILGPLKLNRIIRAQR